MTTTLNIALVAIFLSGLSGCLCQRIQRIRFFTNNACSYTGITPYRDFEDSANITMYSGTQKYQSYCVMTGAWRVQFSSNIDLNVFNISEGDGCRTCISAPTGGPVQNQRQYGVIRHISGKDLTQASFTLYRERHFGGELGSEVEINGHEFTFDETRSFPSFAFSSYSNWSWQLFPLPQFKGTSSFCARSSNSAEVTLYRNTFVTVGSLRLGCENEDEEDATTTPKPPKDLHLELFSRWLYRALRSSNDSCGHS